LGRCEGQNGCQYDICGAASEDARHNYPLFRRRRGIKGEAEEIRKALEETNWSLKEAASLLLISYKVLLL
jgi:hypothetical protein